TAVAKRRVQLLEDISEMAKEVNRTELLIRPGTVIRTPSEHFSSYFTEPKTQIVHMMLSIPRFRDHVSRISLTLGISHRDLEKCISVLKNLNLIEIRDQKIFVLSDELHLPADHSLFPAYRTLMRASAIGKIQNLSEDDSFTYTAVFTGSASTKDYIRNKFLEFLRDVQSATAQEESMDVFQLNFDIFKWS
ncbi:MAG: DUF4423 domain-containing protein, partial [Proteobacteria bacterium]|nr:DUF4423 domain-containing protein [Pseudomonadota bacterium]